MKKTLLFDCCVRRVGTRPLTMDCGACSDCFDCNCDCTDCGSEGTDCNCDCH